MRELHHAMEGVDRGGGAEGGMEEWATPHIWHMYMYICIHSPYIYHNYHDCACMHAYKSMYIQWTITLCVEYGNTHVCVHH